MVSFVSFLQLIHDELVVVVTDNTTVTTPADHVDVLSRTEDNEMPFFGFEYQIIPNSRGLGGNVRNGNVSTDSNDNVTSVEKIRDYEAILDFGVVLDGDRPRQRDEYLGEVQDHFAAFVDDSSKLHADVHRVREDGALPDSGGDSRDVGIRVTYRIEFISSQDQSIPAAETIDWDVDVSGTDAYPEHY